MTDKASLHIVDAVDGRTYLVIKMNCACGKEIHTGTLSEPNMVYRVTWIAECPNPDCHRRYEVGVIEVEAL